MQIQKISYKVRIPGQIEHHYAAFLTRSDDVILYGPFLNINQGRKFATDVMQGKEKSQSYLLLPMPIILLYATETERYDPNIVNLVRTNQIVNCIIIENAPDSIEELKQFARNTLKQVDYGFKTEKSKITSILLAVFLSFWTWLYTYKKDAWKFWVGLGLNALYIFIIFVLMAENVILPPMFLLVMVLGVWIWAIIDTAVKHEQWYKSY